MIKSESHSFLFIHIQRTGGGSVSRMLRANVPDARRFLMPHSHAQEALEKLGNRYPHFYKFSFVRNPWERMVSWFAMLTRHVRQVSKPGWNRYKFAAATSGFENFLNADAVKRVGKSHYSLAFNQLDYLMDTAGNLLVDDVFRLENFTSDCQLMAARCGFVLPRVFHTHKIQHAHYSTYYTPSTKQLIADRFARDIDYLGYRFDAE
jgi:hypothetical protein